MMYYGWLCLVLSTLNAALIGLVLTPMLGAIWAAIIGTVAGIIVMKYFDKISNIFRDDVHRVLNPVNDVTEQVEQMCVLAGLTVSAIMATIWSATIAAPMGVLTIVFIALKALGRF